MRTRTPTRLVDVAREAGVHVSTVSRVLNARDEAA
ncbi:MAG: Bacterial regulatory protein lacI family, partial [Gaiellales bacterium]|nr:Bacterial regulatory protein lacI family [Gaiellales bacterium]